MLAALYAASVRGQTATGPRTGQGVLRLGDRIDPEDLGPDRKALCVAAEGFSLHAGVSVPANDRARLERLCESSGPQLTASSPSLEVSVLVEAAGVAPASKGTLQG